LYNHDVDTWNCEWDSTATNCWASDYTTWEPASATVIGNMWQALNPSDEADEAEEDAANEDDYDDYDDYYYDDYYHEYDMYGVSYYDIDTLVLNELANTLLGSIHLDILTYVATDGTYLDYSTFAGDA